MDLALEAVTGHRALDRVREELGIDGLEDPGQPIVEASHRQCVMRLRRPLGDTPSKHGVRIASIEECVELGLRWCLGVGRLGCFDPVRTIFRGSIVDAEAWVIEPRAIDTVAAFGRSCPGSVQIWKGRFPSRSDVGAVSRSARASETLVPRCPVSSQRAARSLRFPDGAPDTLSTVGCNEADT